MSRQFWLLVGAGLAFAMGLGLALALPGPVVPGCSGLDRAGTLLCLNASAVGGTPGFVRVAVALGGVLVAVVLIAFATGGSGAKRRSPAYSVQRKLALPPPPGS